LDKYKTSPVNFAPLPDFGVAQAVVAALTAKTGIARFLTGLDPPEERLHRQVDAYRYVLKYLTMYLPKLWTLTFEGRIRVYLVIQCKAHLLILPEAAALGKQVIVQPATLIKLMKQLSGLRFARVYAIFERLMHGCIITQGRLFGKHMC
jgi:hypothetical protein